jgi:broad specificity phosphatase PhoE
MNSRLLVLVKHALPVLEAMVPPREWELSPAGEAEAVRLAERLREYLPFRLVASPEPKALRTGEIVAATLGVPLQRRDGLRELDRRPFPIMSAEAHQRVNAAVFDSIERPVLGRESARAALARFSGTILAELASTGSGNVVAVTHGTVISLFVGDHTGLDPFTLWKSLECATFVVLQVPSYHLIEGSRADGTAHPGTPSGRHPEP